MTLAPYLCSFTLNYDPETQQEIADKWEEYGLTTQPF